MPPHGKGEKKSAFSRRFANVDDTEAPPAKRVATEDNGHGQEDASLGKTEEAPQTVAEEREELVVSDQISVYVGGTGIKTKSSPNNEVQNIYSQDLVIGGTSFETDISTAGDETQNLSRQDLIVGDTAFTTESYTGDETQRSPDVVEHSVIVATKLAGVGVIAEVDGGDTEIGLEPEDSEAGDGAETEHEAEEEVGGGGGGVIDIANAAPAAEAAPEVDHFMVKLMQLKEDIAKEKEARRKLREKIHAALLNS